MCDSGEILISFFDQNLNYINDTVKYTDCQSIYGYSILFIDNYKLYYVLSDVTCNGIQYPFDLLDDKENKDNEEEEDEEEEKEEEEEEEKEEEKEEKEEKKGKKGRRKIK